MKKSLEKAFLTIIVIALSLMAFNFYNSYTFKHNPVDKKTLQEINDKVNFIEQKIKVLYGVDIYVDLEVSDKLPARIYGVTFEKNKKLHILLNKSVIKESLDLILDDVIAHEYAHAYLLYKGYDQEKKDGHSKRWQKVCKKLGGTTCVRYVDREDVVKRKLKHLYF